MYLLNDGAPFNPISTNSLASKNDVFVYSVNGVIHRGANLIFAEGSVRARSYGGSSNE